LTTSSHIQDAYINAMNVKRLKKMKLKKQEIIEAINREKLSEEPNFDTIRMLQQMLDDIDNESD